MLRLSSAPFGVPPPRETPGTGERADAVRRLQQSDFFRNYQQAFEATTGLPLVLRAAGSFRPPLQGSRRINPFCALMARAGPTCAACLQVQERVEREATGAATTRECFAGLSESAVPVRIDGQVLGYLQTGQVFLRRPTRRRFNSVALLLAKGSAADGAFDWAQAYFASRVVPPEKYHMIIRLLEVFAEHLASVSHQLLVSQTAADSPMVAKLRRFILEHHREPLGLRTLAGWAHMSPSYFCKTFRAATGLTFTSYLARVRVEAVKEMLRNPDLRISEAAYAAGFQSLSQFNRVFHRVTGEAPTTFRDRQQGRDRASRGPGPASPVVADALPPAAPREDRLCDSVEAARYG
jgi:AraC-like DNA-binding protein/ligand-binding sensor protein